MSLNIDENGNIYLYQGDSGDIVVNGLPTDKNYKVYFSIKDLKNRVVANRLELQSNSNSNVIFSLTPEFTNLLTIPKNEDVGFYTYGLKTVDEDGDENTLFIEGCCYEDKNIVIVFPKKVEV